MDINYQHMPSFEGKPLRKCPHCKKKFEGSVALQFCPYCKRKLGLFVIRNKEGIINE